MNRRDFLKTCGAAGMATATGLGNIKLAISDTPTNENVLVLLFLRGACDGLSFFPPISGADRKLYEAARPGLKIPITGSNAAIDLNGQFGLHPSAAALKPIYDAGNMAIIRATGNIITPSRSHFDAQAFVESGILEGKSFDSGWLTRLYQTLPNQPQEVSIPTVSLTSLTPSLFLGDPLVITMDNPDAFQLNSTHWSWGSPQLEALPALFAGTSNIDEAGAQAVSALQAIENVEFATYEPTGGAVYPESYFGNQLKTIAKLIKDDSAGLRVATLNFGGWDTHFGQDNLDLTGNFSRNLMDPFSKSLAAFLTDLQGLGNHFQRTTVVVQTEFGRRFVENGDLGTDHGYASDMLLFGGAVNGGQIYGDWPGLSNDALFQGEDLMATTDFRHVLSEVITRRMGNPNLEDVFPGYASYQPLGVVRGTDLKPDPPLNSLFSDGFETRA